MGLSNVWQRSSILFRGGVPVSRIFIVDRAPRVSFLSRVPHFYDDDDDVIHHEHISMQSDNPTRR